MSTIRADLGVAGLTDVGYRFYLRDAAVGARVTTGLLDEGAGWYSFPAVSLIGLAADHIRWDSTGTPAIDARTNITNDILLETMAAGGGGGGGGGDPWPIALPGSYSPGSAGYIIGHLNPSAVTLLSPVSISGDKVSVRAGDSWSIPIQGLGNISSPTKLWFSVNKAGQTDDLAKFFIELAAGLTVVNGAAYTPTSDGSITVTDATLGNITVTVQEAVTKLLGGSAVWTVKMLKGGNTITLAQGKFTIAKYGVSAVT